jgi:hypothetical protein
MFQRLSSLNKAIFEDEKAENGGSSSYEPVFEDGTKKPAPEGWLW